MSPFFNGGDERVRTAGLLLARQALSQLSYTPASASVLVVVFVSHSIHFSRCLYLENRTVLNERTLVTCDCLSDSVKRSSSFGSSDPEVLHLRKEVIQPHLPIRLPCYDFTPVIDLTFDDVLLAVRLSASGALNSHGVTGGVYKARERIHRGMLIRDY